MISIPGALNSSLTGPAGSATTRFEVPIAPSGIIAIPSIGQ